MAIVDSAKALFDAIETGKDWNECQVLCHEGASFSCQADMLAEVKTVEGYAAWLRGLFTPVPDMHPEVKACAVDEERSSVSIYSVVHGTQTGEGGPAEPTGKKLATDYVYVMEFEGEKVRHMTKIWNEGYTLQQLGWV